MTHTIQRNAAEILVIPSRLFTYAADAPKNNPLVHISDLETVPMCA